MFTLTATTVAQQLVIKDQRELRVEQGKSITLTLSHITVEADKSLNYPAGFYLEIDDGNNYSVSGSRITAAQTFTGELKVKIRVTNGDKKSGKFNLKIVVFKSDSDGDDDDDDGESDNSNQKPSITGQLPAEANKDQNVTIQLTHLIVTDPDNDYPEDFTLKIEPGNNYQVSGNIITPASSFVGLLTVKVKVNDGKTDSDVFNFQITISNVTAENVEPVITAHTSLSTLQDESITIKLNHLVVTDPDNTYPSDFTLSVLDGSNYLVSGHTVTPTSGFLGTLTVKVSVNDGKDDSNIFDVRINVVEKGILQIIGQAPISISEDSYYNFNLSALNVNDPTGDYPSGFQLTILTGDNYSLDGNTIIPKPDFHGILPVPLKVGKDGSSSEVFEAIIIVQPVNDPPSFSSFDSTLLMIDATSTLVAISQEVNCADIDSETLAFAEVELDSADDLTFLGFSGTDHIRGIFDQSTGILVFIGEASLAEYSKVLQSVTYSSTDSVNKERVVTFQLSDGESYSKRYKKRLSISAQELTLDIPTAFTPNNDNINDTWDIRFSLQDEQSVMNVRVFNKRGLLLFESHSFEDQWDGRYNGELLPADSYFYTVEVSSGNKSERRNGSVTILR